MKENFEPAESGPTLQQSWLEAERVRVVGVWWNTFLFRSVLARLFFMKFLFFSS